MLTKLLTKLLTLPGSVARSGAEDAQKKGRVGRGVTLNMLMAEGIVAPAEKALTVEYLGKV
jgi:hypothetical protein